MSASGMRSTRRGAVAPVAGDADQAPPVGPRVFRRGRVCFVRCRFAAIEVSLGLDRTGNGPRAPRRLTDDLSHPRVPVWWSWSYSPRTGLLYIPFNRSCLNQTANDRSVAGTGPRFTIPESGLEEDGDLTELRAIDIWTGREAWRYSQRAPNAGSSLATGGDIVFHGDLNRRWRAFDAETGEGSGRRSSAAKSPGIR